MTRPMIRKTLLALVAAAMILVAGGCHYRLTDPTSGRVFYTRDTDARWSLAPGEQVRFRDGVTGETVTLHWPKIETISPAEYERGAP